MICKILMPTFLSKRCCPNLNCQLFCLTDVLAVVILGKMNEVQVQMQDDRTRWCLLLDYYGALLSRQQHEALKHYVEDDLSLSEIGDLLKISRQGVHDLIRRATCRLSSYEERLGLVQRDQEMYDTLCHASRALDEGEHDVVERDLQTLAHIIGLGTLK
jgi:predicted DNA-binding protein YlxM (UPF0122 family)